MPQRAPADQALHDRLHKPPSRSKSTRSLDNNPYTLHKKPQRKSEGVSFDEVRFKKVLRSKCEVDPQGVVHVPLDQLMTLVRTCTAKEVPYQATATLPPAATEHIHHLPEAKQSVVRQALLLAQNANLVCAVTGLSPLPPPRHPYKLRGDKYGVELPADRYVTEQEWADLAKAKLLYLPWLARIDEPLQQAIHYLARKSVNSIDDFAWGLGIWTANKLENEGQHSTQGALLIHVRGIISSTSRTVGSR